MNVSGPASSAVVSRLSDVYGLTPPTYTIEGTTGWDYHDSDGGILTGMQSMQLLQQFLSQYAQLNQTQRRAGNPQFYTLEFYDFFSDQFWQVEPVGPQAFRQSEQRPTLTYYRFHWEAIQPAGIPAVGLADALAQLIATPAQTAIANAALTMEAVAFAYTPAGLVGGAVNAVTSFLS